MTVAHAVLGLEPVDQFHVPFQRAGPDQFLPLVSSFGRSAARRFARFKLSATLGEPPFSDAPSVSALDTAPDGVP